MSTIAEKKKKRKRSLTLRFLQSRSITNGTYFKRFWLSFSDPSIEEYYVSIASVEYLESRLYLDIARSRSGNTL